MTKNRLVQCLILGENGKENTLNELWRLLSSIISRLAGIDGTRNNAGNVPEGARYEYYSVQKSNLAADNVKDNIKDSDGLVNKGKA